MDTQAVTDLLSQLIAIESINPDLVPGGSGEGELARFVAAWLTQAGLEVMLHDTAPGRPNVIAVARGTGGGRSLMLNAHTDTVGVAGMQNPFQPEVREGKLYGRGAYDMKGSLAACMLAMVRIKALGLAGDVMLTAVTDEEFASIGTAAIAKSWGADAAIITEPTEMRLCIAHKGFVWFEVETVGRAAHGSRPDLGIDAIAKMGRILTGLEALQAELSTGPRHPLLGTGSIHASMIEGGQEQSSYPERCLLKLERRIIPGETPALAQAQIQALIDQAAAEDPTFKASVRMTLTQGSFEIAPDAPIVVTVRDQVIAHRGAAPEEIGLGFWMDSALLDGAGIPTVIFGPGGAGAHALVEWVDLGELAQCIDIYTAVAKAFCG